MIQDATEGKAMLDDVKRKDHNELFLRRLLARRPEVRARYEERLAHASAGRPELEGLPGVADAVPKAADRSRVQILETIVDEERPVLFVQNGTFNTTEVTTLGIEAEELVLKMRDASQKLLPLLPLIGRFDVVNFPGADYLGTGWFVDADVVVTNRHVASLIAANDGRRFVFRKGLGGQPIVPSLCNAHEYDDADPDASRIFAIKEVLYIEPENGPNDIAFVRVLRQLTGASPPFITVASTDAADNLPVCVIGYPARAPRRVIPDQNLMAMLYRGRFDVKRAAPGFSMGTKNGASEHDCTTLGGNSGSVVLDFNGNAVGLHFAGLYQQANYAVTASVLKEYISRKRWNQPAVIERPTAPQAPKPSPAPVVQAVLGGSNQTTITIPLTITIGIGTPIVGSTHGATLTAHDTGAMSPEKVEQAVLAYWDSRPKGILAARVGYFDDGDRIGDQPCIAASVMQDQWPTFEATGQREFQGVPIRYFLADVDEQLSSHPALESVDSIAYDDDARTGAEFSFTPVNESMDITLHVGPEYSWDQLKGFLDGANGRMVSAMYEFHGLHIKEAFEQAFRRGASLKLVLDNATFSRVHDRNEEFDRVDVFERWAENFPFERIVAPKGRQGLISDSYHIKVTVREDDTFWLSSGNWKMGSSQPPITQEQRDHADEVDLPGNREWHVIIKNHTLASRFRSHILQDFRRAADLGGRELPARLLDETFVDVPIEEAVVEERRPPSRIIKPREIHRPVNVKPLLTPDMDGEVYSEAVLELIRSARRSLLFQIPYIAMPSNPREDRGSIDELILALTDKLKTLDDARVILRTGGQKFSSPAHAAWYFKSKGVDIDACLRVIENHHTKGMIVDGKRVLVGSHNWSKPGVSLNRDASLLFDDAEIASYYADSFEVDWQRSNPVRPRRFVRPEAAILEAVGAAPPPGYHRVRLSDWLKDD
jgi:hypothetical protein